MTGKAQLHFTVTDNVRHQIAKFNRGRIFSIDSIQVKSGSSQTLQRSLSRLVEESLIKLI